ncbi:nuclear transport factor 2 family protein [Microbacterium sp. X-17]|uniref:YybH family protein n=1 Tax=Microbacterium sp. X-17 TaxID=3144404 RepID=UPI0031F4F106
MRTARTPEEVEEIYIASMNAGDLEGALAVFDVDTVFVGPTEAETIHGVDGIRVRLAAALALDPQHRVLAQRVVHFDDYAVLFADWELDRLDTEGGAVHLRGSDTSIVRQREDGAWTVLRRTVTRKETRDPIG